MKETIGIEALLHRAYGQYRVDRVTPGAILGLPRTLAPSGSLTGAMQAVQLGTIIDNSGVAARMLGQQTMAIATPDDLLIVHDHVLALADWLIEEARSDEPRVWRRSEIAGQGWRVESAATGLWLVRPGEGRKGADLWARLTDPYLAALVIEHARAGTSPDHGAPLPSRRGRPSAADAAARGDVMLSRALYAVWHAALGVLVAELRGRLAKHDVTGPVVPAAPWNGQDDRRVIDAEAVRPAKRANVTRRKSLREHYNRRF